VQALDDVFARRLTDELAHIGYWLPLLLAVARNAMRSHDNYGGRGREKPVKSKGPETVGCNDKTVSITSFQTKPKTQPIPSDFRSLLSWSRTIGWHKTPRNWQTGGSRRIEPIRTVPTVIADFYRKSFNDGWTIKAPDRELQTVWKSLRSEGKQSITVSYGHEHGPRPTSA